MGSLIGLVVPWSGWLPGPAVCRGCWLPVGWAGWQGGWLQSSGSPRASAGSLVGRVNSWGLAAGPGGPRGSRSGVGLLVDGAGSWHSWLRGQGCPEVCVGLLVGEARAQPVPGQVLLASWSLSWVLQLWGCCCPGAGVHQLVGRLVLRLEQAYWWAGQGFEG